MIYQDEATREVNKRFAKIIWNYRIKITLFLLLMSIGTSIAFGILWQLIAVNVFHLKEANLISILFFGLGIVSLSVWANKKSFFRSWKNLSE